MKEIVIMPDNKNNLNNLINGDDDYYSLMPKRKTKRSEDIPIDDFLIDDIFDTDAENKTQDQQNVNSEQTDQKSEEQIEKIQPKSAEESVEQKVSDNAGSVNESAAYTQQNTDNTQNADNANQETHKKTTLKSKKLRKNLGVDDSYYDVTKNNVKAKKKRKYLSFEAEERRRKVFKGLVGVFAAICVVYAGIYGVVNIYNNDYYEQTTERLTTEVAEEAVLAVESYYLDGDMDSLSDAFEKDIFGTDIFDPDSDGDGMSDGEEYLAKTDPLSAESNGGDNYKKTLYVGDAELQIDGKIGETASAYMNEYNSTVNRYPGIIGKLYEINGAGENAKIILEINPYDLEKWETAEENIGLFRMNINDLTVSEIDAEYSDGKLTGKVTADGAYFAADKSLFNIASGTDVMFLIDNSGSMYSKELVQGSEENDLDFKRVDLSQQLVDELGENTNFGVAKFTATYSLLSPVSSDANNAKANLERIRTGTENFNGTEISGSIMLAANEFKDSSRRKFIIMITDGLPSVEDEEKEIEAIETCIEKNISIVAISLGKQTDTEYLSEIAEKTNGMFYQVINADSFGDIAKKIKDYLYNVRISINKDDGENISVTALSDSGFTSADCIKTAGVPTTYSISGNLIGSAVVNKMYYTGDIPLMNAEYSLTSEKFFISGKENLGNYEVPARAYYDQYIANEDKWNFDSADGMLEYGETMSAWLAERPFKIISAKFSSDVVQSDTLLMLRAITFQRLKDFSTYEKAVLDVDAMTKEEQQIWKAVGYYDKPKKMYSFGSESDDAFKILSDEISEGIPSVLTTDNGMVFNVSKLMRNTDDPNEYVIEGINLLQTNSSSIIYLEKRMIYDGAAGSHCQYVAKYKNEEIKLFIVE